MKDEKDAIFRATRQNYRPKIDLNSSIQPMKTDTKRNFGPLSRASAALPLVAVVATLCLMPVTGIAQIFVANEGNDTIGKYDATTAHRSTAPSFLPA